MAYRNLSPNCGWGPIVFGAGLLLALASPLIAADYYVAREAPGASDSNDGRSPTHGGGNSGPWKSLVQAATSVVAGDTVHVFTGDYRDNDMGWGVGRIALQTSGTQTAPLRFVAPAGQTATLFAFRLVQSEWIEIEGFHFVNPGLALPGNWVDMPATIVDDPAVVIVRDEPWATREAKVRRKYATFMSIMDYFNTDYPAAIDVDGADNVRIAGNTFTLYSFGVQLRNSAVNVIVENNSFTYCRNGVFTWRTNPSTVGSIVRNNTFRQTFADGIDVREDADGVLIEGNVSEFSAIGHYALHSGARNTTIRGNIARYGGYYTETMEYPGSTAINVHTAGPGNVVEGNLAAYQVDPTLYDGNGYIVDLLYGPSVTLRNNIAYRNMGSGIALVHSPNGIIVNNTLVENGYQTPDAHNGAGIRMSHVDDIDNIIVNNVFSRNGVSGIYSYHLLEAQTVIDNNFYDQPGTALIWDGWLVTDRYYTTLPEVQSGFGAWEQNGLAGDPGFLDAAGVNFHIDADSPAVDGGRSAAYVPGIDFDGSVRIAAPDCGAYEALLVPPEVSGPAGAIPLLLLRDPEGMTCATGYCLSFESMAGARGYNVYEGTVGDWYSHGSGAGIACDATTIGLGNGVVMHAVSPSNGNHYYLVTAFSAQAEGTAGNPASDAQRTCPP